MIRYNTKCKHCGIETKVAEDGYCTDYCRKYGIPNYEIELNYEIKNSAILKKYT